MCRPQQSAHDPQRPNAADDFQEAADGELPGPSLMSPSMDLELSGDEGEDVFATAGHQQHCESHTV